MFFNVAVGIEIGNLLDDQSGKRIGPGRRKVSQHRGCIAGNELRRFVKICERGKMLAAGEEVDNQHSQIS